MKLSDLTHTALRPFDFISPRMTGSVALGVGLMAALADHIPQLGSEEHRYTLGGLAIALIGLLVRILADQHRMGGSLRSHNAKQDQEIQALIVQAMQQDPRGPVALLLKSRLSQSPENGGSK